MGSWLSHCVRLLFFLHDCGLKKSGCVTGTTKIDEENSVKEKVERPEAACYRYQR